MADREPLNLPDADRQDPQTGAYLATPKQLLRIYHAYLKAGLTDTDRLTDIANTFTKRPVDHWMDIYQTTASRWISAIEAVERVQMQRQLARHFDPWRHDDQ